MPFDVSEHLKTLITLHAPSGFEMPVAQALREAWTPYADSLTISPLGALTALRRGTQTETAETPRRRVLITAHMDEIGMLVRKVRDGFLQVVSLGGIDPSTLPGSSVLVHGRQTLPAVIGAPPSWALPIDARKRFPTLDELYIDTGLPAADVAALVRIGDLVTLEQTPFSLGENLLSGKAMDDRACLAAITVMLDHLSRRLHEWDVLAVAAVQEEVGANAMVVETAHLKPDIGIALDVTFATQPGVIGEGAFKLGAGVPISLGANFHPALYEAIREAAKRLEMELPVDPLPMHSGTDAWDVQVAGEGVPTALLNLPIRNMHTAIETVHLTDVTRLGRLLAEFVCGLTPEFMATIVWEKAKEENPS